MRAPQQNRPPRSLLDKHVQFRVRDAHVPECDEILRELHGQDTLQGTVTDLTDSGAVRGAFAVVEVSGLSRQVVVPVAKIWPMKE